MEANLYYFFGLLILLNLLILFNVSTSKTSPSSTIRSSVDVNAINRLEELLKEATRSYLRSNVVNSNPALQSKENEVNYAPHYSVKPDACKHSELYGRPHHGGWVACAESISTDCIVYSYGLGADWSFDNALEQAGCEIHGFDPSGCASANC